MGSPWKVSPGSTAHSLFFRQNVKITQNLGSGPESAASSARRGALDPLPEAPDQEMAWAAADRLFELVKQFPFAGATPEEKADNFAAWLAGFLAVLARPAFEGECPGVAFNADKAGTGKVDVESHARRMLARRRPA